MELEASENCTSQFMFDNDGALMNTVLTPYKNHCQYLQSAFVFSEGDRNAEEYLSSKGEFSIPKSCYIDDTGHFNSVEFNICYNQLMYYTIAKAVSENASSFFDDWDLPLFCKKQLPDILIVGFKSSFRKPVEARKFRGEMQFTKSRIKSSVQYIATTVEFSDDNSGFCNGEVNLAIV